tara:strand:- start:1177 stop:1608 length:432 start_codon:yes stop_codon:yes gene_type:complete
MYSILYISRASESCDKAAIQQILQSSRQNNQINAITGILIHKSPHFLQYLEGPPEAVGELYEKIESDDRHDSVKVISRSEIDNRIFSNWEMGFASEEDLRPLQWKWELDKLSLFSLANTTDKMMMDVIKLFIGTEKFSNHRPV